jgi:hypothetical protein
MIIKKDIYNGDDIHQRFAYQYFRDKVLPTGNIVAFRAPMQVTDNLVDLEDALNKDFIYSEDAVNFIIEIPNIDLFGGVCFQRLLMAQIGSLLCGKFLEGTDGYVDGDDIMIKAGDEYKKASVSIACQKNNAVLIHIGVNIKAGDKAPEFAYSTNLDDEKAEEFMKNVIEMFYMMSRDIFVATTKTIV